MTKERIQSAEPAQNKVVDFFERTVIERSAKFWFVVGYYQTENFFFNNSYCLIHRSDLERVAGFEDGYQPFQYSPAAISTGYLGYEKPIECKSDYVTVPTEAEIIQLRKDLIEASIVTHKGLFSQAQLDIDTIIKTVTEQDFLMVDPRKLIDSERKKVFLKVIFLFACGNPVYFVQRGSFYQDLEGFVKRIRRITIPYAKKVIIDPDNEAIADVIDDRTQAYLYSLTMNSSMP